LAEPTDKLERRIRKLEALLAQRSDIAEGIIKDVTIDAIKTKMYAANYSMRIIDNVELVDVEVVGKKINWKIWNELIVGSGFDIALGRERGIRKHDIFGNPVLVWRGSTIIGTPTTIFAAHVKHPGVQATFIIRDTVRETRALVQERYKQSIQNKIQEIRNSS